MPPIDYDNYHATLPVEKRPTRKPLRSEVLLAVLAGLSAATASLFGKLAMEERTASAASTAYYFIQKLDLDILLDLNQTLWLVRALFAGAMILANAAMWAFFTKSLSRTQSSARVTVINSCANFCFTALFGHVCFNEPLAMRWWFGAALMVAGGMLVAAPPAVASTPTVPNRDQPYRSFVAMRTNDKVSSSSSIDKLGRNLASSNGKATSTATTTTTTGGGGGVATRSRSRRVASEE
ncbi:hypothetical protein BDF22DRAFT_657404 [Syncephalis plumigaleata]|nr:hypothetical protein BDF22DRAFT_657404 [Syncephalis plumigaleata]